MEDHSDESGSVTCEVAVSSSFNDRKGDEEMTALGPGTRLVPTHTETNLIVPKGARKGCLTMVSAIVTLFGGVEPMVAVGSAGVLVETVELCNSNAKNAKFASCRTLGPCVFPVCFLLL